MLAALALAQSFSFVVIGHTRGGPGAGALPTARYEEMVGEIQRLEPDFVVLTGDLVYGDFEAKTVDAVAVQKDWEAVDAVFGRLGCPVHRVPGNHDVWEPTTRDIWIERYGALNKSFEHEGSRFILLNSCWTPEPGENAQCPPRFIRGVQIGAEGGKFLERELDLATDARHVFVFLGHVLWWEDDAYWWEDIHPMLTRMKTRAVFSGDLGPWKFSHLERDGIDYVQSSVEFANPPIVMQRNREAVRAITEQLDNYAYVTVDGDDVRIEIKTLGALTTDLFTPAKYREVHDYDAGSFERKVFNRMDTPQKLVGWLWKLGLTAFTGGVLVALIACWLFRKR